MEERTGEAFELDEKLTVIGPKLEVGQQAPDFALEHIDPESPSLGKIRLSDSNGKIRLINTVNSVDTPVCHVETRQWEKVLAELPPGVVAYTISMDLPFALERWRAAEHVNHALLSAHKDADFGQDFGVLIKEWRLLQRAAFVVDQQGRVVHAEYVADQMREPSYAAAIKAIRKASDLSGAES